MLCRLLQVPRAGFYEWLHKPLSDPAIEGQRLLTIVRAIYEAGQGVYGSPLVFFDFR